MDTNDWLNGAARCSLALPPRYNVITSLPDISELGTRRQRLSPEQYEQWVVQVVSQILNILPPNQVAIFYQTPGRTSGIDGGWLDKGFLCQLGAREAGARCVWQKIALDGPPGIERAGRPAFVNMMCFSKLHRLPPHDSGFKTVDVLFRGRLAYQKAMGRDACLVAVEYCSRWVDRRGSGDDGTAAYTSDHNANPGAHAAAAVLDPFCGYGTVLAAANQIGTSAFGMDISTECCKRALSLPCEDIESQRGTPRAGGEKAKGDASGGRREW